MVRDRSDEYDGYAPLLVELAGLDPSDPRRARVRDELVAGYLPVARNIARRFARRGEPLEDLEQVATVALLHALDRFDPERRRDFLSFAVPTIMGEVRRYFRDHAWSVHTPRSIKDRYLAVSSATAQLSHQLGRAPTISELAEHLELDRDAVAEAVAAHGSYQPTSLDVGLTNAGGENIAMTLADSLVAEGPGSDGLDRAEQRVILHDLVRHLPERERRILALRFVQDKTQAEIGEELCISQMHVSRLLVRTLELLRERARRAEPRRAVTGAA